ncbi:hypothetical protein CHU98_g4060 [Xylaria longipes]|nr:hypothetical protein CHU98_g4060 [Xylaria longipes]
MANNQAEPANSNPKSLSGFKEKEEDMFVLIDRANPWKDGKLVSSHNTTPAKDTKSADNGKSAKEKDGWETATLVGGSSQWSKVLQCIVATVYIFSTKTLAWQPCIIPQVLNLLGEGVL